MAITPQPTVPNRLTQTQAEFSQNSSNIVDWMGDFADDLNAVSATYLLGVTGTSTTSNTIGTGSKSFTTQTGLGFAVGQTLRVAHDSTNYMTGDVTSYDSGTGALVINVTSVEGSGTETSWTISLAAVGANNASSVAFTPAGNIASTDVQAAIEELDSEKLSNADGAVASSKLADVVTASSVGSSSAIPVITYNAKGQITSTSTATKITNATAQATTSGTSKDFTSIPSTAKRITVMFSGVSTSGTSIPIIQIGDSGGVETSGYLGSAWESNTGNSANSSGFKFHAVGEAAKTLHGAVTLSLLDASTFTWVASGNLSSSANTTTINISGSKSLSAALDRVRITTTNGTDTFDAGTVNISYE